MMVKRLLLLLLWCGLILAGTAPSQIWAAKPNVLVILTDDQGWGDLSLNGNVNLATPRIDSLARDGVKLDRFFVCPLCAPTRAEFLTGRFFARTGVHGVSTGQERLNLDETTIAQTFKAAGYRTGAFGKWHNGTQAPYHPNNRGFEEFYGFCSGHWGHYFDAEMDHNGEPVKGTGFMADDLTERAMQFMEKNREQPFFCYVPFNTPHSPMQVPERFYQKFAKAELPMRGLDSSKEDLAHTRAALAMCENVDWNVGRLLDHLNKLGLEKDTIVIYFTDNGPNGGRWNGGMKGQKGNVDEGGVRVPCLMRWPGGLPKGRTVNEIAGAIDLLSTLADLAGVPLLRGKALDGKSLKPLLLGEEDSKWEDRNFISMQAGNQKREVSVRSQRYRLDPSGALFDMVSDPGQQRDVAAMQPDKVRRLKEVRAGYLDEVAPVLAAAKERSYTVGWSKRTLLPARDGVPHGGVERSAKAPNCSFFTNWKTMEDRMTWEIESKEAGRYRAILYATCKAADVGAEVELTFDGKSVRGTLSEAFDSPLKGSEEDRVGRKGESLVKEFKPYDLGVMELSQARQTLTLRAVKIPGQGVADVRYVALERVDD